MLSGILVPIMSDARKTTIPCITHISDKVSRMLAVNKGQLVSTECASSLVHGRILGCLLKYCKFHKFLDTQNIAVITLKLQENGCKKSVDGIVNSEDPDQTAPLGAV